MSKEIIKNTTNKISETKLDTSITVDLTTKKTKRKLGIADGKYNIDYDEFDRLDEEIIEMFDV